MEISIVVSVSRSDPISQGMKLLLLGKRHGTLRWFESVLASCQNYSGLEVLPFPVNHSGLVDRVVKNLLKSVGRRHLDQYVARQFEQVFNTFCPDLVLIVDYFHVPEQILEFLSTHKGTAIVAWWIGDLFRHEKVMKYGCVDRFYFTDSYFLDYAAQGGIINGSYLPLACDPFTYRLKNYGDRKKQLVFVGAYSENRASLLNKINSKVLLVGKQWEVLVHSKHDVLAKRIPVEEVAKLYNEHVAVLNVKNSNNVVNGLNMRTFDAPVCGCVVLNDDLGDLERCFEIGNEILVYRNAEELDDLVSRIMSDELFRKAIATAGRKRVLAEHLYEHRISSILNDLL